MIVRLAFLICFCAAIGGFITIASAQPAAKKLPVPSDERVAEAATLIAEVYKNELLAAKTPVQKRALAAKLFTDAEGSKSDPTAKFALLGEANKLAAQIGDVELATSATEAIVSEYEVSPATFVAAGVTDVAKNAKTPEQSFQILRWLEFRFSLPRAADDYAALQRLADQGLVSAKITKDKDSIEEWVRRVKEQKTEAEAYAALAQPLKVLESMPTDPAANGAVGKFRTFLQGDWKFGIPLLALGDDKELAAIAERDLKLPADSAARKTLADAWYSWAAAQSATTKTAALSRAAHWYRQALPELSGLDKTLAANRIAEAEALTSPFREGRWVELLDKVDVGRHVLTGSWQRKGLSVVASEAAAPQTLALPIKLDGSFELRIRATRVKRNFSILCPDPKHSFGLIFNGNDNNCCGINVINGAFAFQSKNPARAPAVPIDPSQVLTLLAHVKRASGVVAAELQYNGRRCVAWKGSEDSLSNDVPITDKLAIRTREPSVVLLSVQFRTLGGNVQLTD